jgi:hypothetical protein
MTSLPRRIPGSQQPLSDQLTASFFIDRNLCLEVGKAVMVIFTSDEVAALYQYLHRNKKKFVVVATGDEVQS